MEHSVLWLNLQLLLSAEQALSVLEQGLVGCVSYVLSQGLIGVLSWGGERYDGGR